MNESEEWALVLSAAVSRPVSDPGSVLRTAVRLGLGVAPAAVACSLTQRLDSGYRTTVSTHDLAVDLDQVQYSAGVGPCLSAATHGSVERLDDIARQTRYPAFGSAAAERDIRSSLSLGLGQLDQPAALNLYASAPAAFAGTRSLAVADLLARSVAAVLGGGREPVRAGDTATRAIQDRRARVRRAEEELMARNRISRPEAFAVLALRSREQGRSIDAIAHDLLDGGQDTL